MNWNKTITKSGTPIKILLGGSPCTKWSIAQKNGREVLPEGIGWELFENYQIAKEKFQPDIFLYENNKSAAQPIKDAIYSALGGGKDASVRITHINSALVSAQNRERFYVTNFGDIEQPKDRRILLLDVLETDWTTDQAKLKNTIAYRFGSVVPVNTTADGKARTVKAQYYKSGIANFVTNGGYPTTAVAIPVYLGTKSINEIDGKPIYMVNNGLITVKDKQYPIKLADGYYLIRKLTPTECERLQTLPDGYTSGVSDTQRYRAIGNGWTAEVIIHILNHALKDVPRDKELVVLSMYDGIATGRYCLDKMGFTNVKYYAYEIDPYAQKIAMSNYPDIVQCGDAFQIRNF